jgi:hypothetical protein
MSPPDRTFFFVFNAFSFFLMLLKQVKILPTAAFSIQTLFQGLLEG